MKLKDIKPNPNNPRVIRDEKFQKLKKSIEEFPKMMALRPMVINADNIVLGGNMRLRALQDLGYKEVPNEWVRRAEDLTEDEQRRFIIADNVGFGEHDWEMLTIEWDVDELEDWGLDVSITHEDVNKTSEVPDIGEIEFSEELLLEHNYIVLYFDNAMDWEVAQEVYGLGKVKSKDSSDLTKKIGIGRVVNGKNFI